MKEKKKTKESRSGVIPRNTTHQKLRPSIREGRKGVPTSFPNAMAAVLMTRGRRQRGIRVDVEMEDMNALSTPK